MRVYTYSASPELWWKPIEPKLARYANLTVQGFGAPEVKALGDLVERSMSLSCTIQDGEVWLRDGQGREAHLGLSTLK